MTALSTREALVTDAVCDAVYRALNKTLGEPDQGSGTNSRRWDLAWGVTHAVADALLAFGAVVDAATLADEIERRIQSSVFPVPPGVVLRSDNGYLSATTMRAHLREVFAALTERGGRRE